MGPFSLKMPLYDPHIANPFPDTTTVPFQVAELPTRELRPSTPPTGTPAATTFAPVNSLSRRMVAPAPNTPPVIWRVDPVPVPPPFGVCLRVIEDVPPNPPGNAISVPPVTVTGPV